MRPSGEEERMKRRTARNRRRFLGALGIAGLGAAVAPTALIAGTLAAKSSKPRASKPPAAATPPAANAPPPPSDDALALAEIVRRRYGAHLSPEQLEGVTREIEQRLGGGRALRAAKLANGDEPDVTFHA
jgi:hypothetical protein